MTQSAFQLNFIETTNMTTEAKQIEVPNLEATSDNQTIRRETNFLTETVTRKISAIHKEKIQNRHYRIDTGSRNDTKRLPTQRNVNTRRFLHTWQRQY